MTFSIGEPVAFTETEAPLADDALPMTVVELTSSVRVKVRFPTGVTSYYRVNVLAPEEEE